MVNLVESFFNERDVEGLIKFFFVVVIFVGILGGGILFRIFDFG